MDSGDTKKPYFGVDRRKFERRVLEDQRIDIRWEPGKEDRRSGQDRRQSNLPDEDPWDQSPNR